MFRSTITGLLFFLLLIASPTLRSADPKLNSSDDIDPNTYMACLKSMSYMVNTVGPVSYDKVKNIFVNKLGEQNGKLKFHIFSNLGAYVFELDKKAELMACPKCTPIENVVCSYNFKIELVSDSGKKHLIDMYFAKEWKGNKTCDLDVYFGNASDESLSFIAKRINLTLQGVKNNELFKSFLQGYLEGLYAYYTDPDSIFGISENSITACNKLGIGENAYKNSTKSSSEKKADTKSTSLVGKKTGSKATDLKN